MEAVKVVLHKNFIIGNVESDLIDFKVIWRAFFLKSFQRMNKIVLDIVLYCFGYCFILFWILFYIVLDIVLLGFMVRLTNRNQN